MNSYFKNPMNPELPGVNQKDPLQYSEELVGDYTKERSRFNETDKILFSAIEKIGGVEGKRVLDLGCGDGTHAQMLKEMGAHSVVGVDVSEHMIKKAIEKSDMNGDVAFLVADGSKLPLSDQSLDLVVSNYVLQYFKNTDEVFMEIGRVLTHGGYFVGTINVIEMHEDYKDLHNTEIPIRLGSEDAPVTVRFFIKSTEELQAAVARAGLTLVSTEEMTHPNSVVSESYSYREYVKKHAMLYTLRK